MLLLFCGSCLLLTSCHEKDDYLKKPPTGKVEGYRPVYGKPDEYKEGDELQKLIVISTALPLANPGKIYFKDGYVFINEPGKGIHIIDNKNPREPKQISFINIYGNQDMAIRNNTLYADRTGGLLCLDISNIENIKVAGYTGKIFSYKPQPVLPPRDNISGNGYTYFECIDTSKGQVTGWERATLENPTCFR